MVANPGARGCLGMSDPCGIWDPASPGSPQHPSSDGSREVDPSPLQEGWISSWDAAVGLAHNCCPFSPPPARGMPAWEDPYEHFPTKPVYPTH